MSGKYILDANGQPIECDDIHEWARWFEKDENRRVALDEVGDVRVSTIFLGLALSWGGEPPLLWETMIFGGEHGEYQERYSTREAALEGHARALALVKGGK